MDRLRSRLSADLGAALKEKDGDAIKAIRSLIAAIDNAGAVAVESPTAMPISGGIAGASDGLGSTEVPRRVLSSGEIRRIIQEEITEIRLAIRQIGDPSRPEIASLARQAEILGGYLD